MKQTGIAKAFVKPDQMAIISRESDVLSRKPSTEQMVHLQTLRKRPHAVTGMGAHPSTVVARAIAKPDLKQLPVTVFMSDPELAAGFHMFFMSGTMIRGLPHARRLLHPRALVLQALGAVAGDGDLDAAHRERSASSEVPGVSGVFGGIDGTRKRPMLTSPLST